MVQIYLKSEVSRVVSAMRDISGPIPTSVRGWQYRKNPVKPPVDGYLVSIHALTSSSCPNMRDIYLRYVEKISPQENELMVIGNKVHGAFRAIVGLSRTLVSSGGIEEAEELLTALISKVERIEDERIRKLMKKLSFRVAHKVATYMEINDDTSIQNALNSVVPSSFEYVVDGSFIGLSKRLKVDAMIWGLPIEIKLGFTKDRHKMAIAGYALALEASEGIPIDMGILTNVYLGNSKVKIQDSFIYISEDLRMRFIELRDEALDVIASGIDPQRPTACPESCYYYQICQGGGRDSSSGGI